jgi:iron complex outermembrane receptor protein
MPAASYAQATAAAPGAQAATASPADDADSNDGKIADIVVTAQRVEQRLQEVPVAVTAISGSSLAARGVNSVLAMTAQVPGLTVNRQLGIVNLYIRGIGNNFANLGGDPNVALHEDGVYIARPRAQVTAFMDVDRIEVLRGPQGTLYGRNATGGSINIITRQPTDTLQANADISVGNYDLVKAEGGVGGPIADGLAVRVALMGARHSGYGKNLVTGNDIDNLREWGGRFSARWDMSDTLRYVVTADYYHAADRANSFHYLGTQPGFVPLGVVQGGSVPTDFRDIVSERDPSRRVKVYGFAGIGTWNLSDQFTLKSTTAYRKSVSLLNSDGDGTDKSLFRLDHNEHARQISEELQATYKSDKITAIGGLFYFNEKVSGATKVLLLLLGPNAVGGSGPATGETKAYAGYGQIAYKITDALTVTAAARYSHETRNNVGFAAATPLPFREKSWNAFTPRFVLDYKISDSVMAYASVSKGFKSGAFLIGNPQPAVNPETIWDYEVGLKSQFLDRHVQLNLAGFYYDYKDLQVSRPLLTTTVVENAASATIKGAEMELTVLPWTGSRLDVVGTYLNARFGTFTTNDQTYVLPQGYNLSGYHLPFTPTLTATFRAQQQFLLPSGKLDLDGDVTYTTRSYSDAFNFKWRGQGPNAIVNARATYTFPSNRISVSVWARNLTDKLVFTNAQGGAALIGAPILGAINDPRTVGATFSVKL